MLPTLDVGLSHGDFADLVRAQRLVVAMQRLSYLPLQPRVLPFGDAATSSLPALLIAADGKLPTPVALPMDTADQGSCACRVWNSVDNTVPCRWFRVRTTKWWR